MRCFVTGGSGFVGRELIRALVAAGHGVRAIARSEKSEAAVRAAGAESVRGDLDDVAALQKGMQGCDWIFHSAAHTEEWDTDEAFWRVNVVGTDNVMAAGKAAGVKRFVLISSEAVLADGSALVDVDETRPLPEKALPGYPFSKGECERRVRAANQPGVFETVIVRPRYIWGRGDTSVLAKFVVAVKNGRFKWIGGGRYPTTTTHVANVCEGVLLAAEKGKPGETYFITDGKPVEFRWFLTELLKTQGITIPDSSVPLGMAKLGAAVSEGIWRTFGVKSTPPVTRVTVALMGQHCTINDAKARRELGYQGKVTHAEGLAELAKP